MLSVKEKFLIISIVAFVFGLALGVVLMLNVGMTNNLNSGTKAIECTLEAKICPDGSAVGRSGPRCEFAPCPASTDMTVIGDIPEEEIFPEGGSEGGDAVMCTMEAKLCPDGSYVGRAGPKCEFAPCPSGGTMSTGNCVRDSDCTPGYSCIDVSPVIREGSQNLRCWKDGTPTPICLSGVTHIATPEGDILVKDIKKGDLVWSIDAAGKKVVAPILASARTSAPTTHQIIHLTLSDERELFASPGHKVGDGRTLGSLANGESLDGAIIIAAILEPYEEAYTYDILPDSVTGKYWANGVLLQSTLKK